MRAHRLFASLAALCTMACGADRHVTGGVPDDLAESAAVVFDLASPANIAPPDLTQPFMGTVYAHSPTDLYKIDPGSLAVTHIGAFRFAGAADQLTDIAVDKDGNIIGVSFTKVYSVNHMNAACKELSTIGATYNGLSFVPPDQIDPGGGGNEILVASDLNGNLTKIDPVTGKATLIGNYGGGWVSSGDLVAVEGLGAFATVTTGSAFAGNDSLARIDLAHGGKALIIGDIGFAKIWGLGFWRDKLFGFTEGGEFITIDIKTGHGNRVQAGSTSWWGAGVSTSAPVMIM